MMVIKKPCKHRPPKLLLDNVHNNLYHNQTSVTTKNILVYYCNHKEAKEKLTKTLNATGRRPKPLSS